MSEQIIVQCYNCHTYQICFLTKNSKFSCKVCSEQQSIQKIFERAEKGSVLRPIVQQLNIQRAHGGCGGGGVRDFIPASSISRHHDNRTNDDHMDSMDEITSPPKLNNDARYSNNNFIQTNNPQSNNFRSHQPLNHYHHHGHHRSSSGVDTHIIRPKNDGHLQPSSKWERFIIHEKPTPSDELPKITPSQLQCTNNMNDDSHIPHHHDTINGNNTPEGYNNTMTQKPVHPHGYPSFQQNFSSIPDKTMTSSPVPSFRHINHYRCDLSTASSSFSTTTTTTIAPDVSYLAKFGSQPFYKNDHDEIGNHHRNHNPLLTPTHYEDETSCGEAPSAASGSLLFPSLHEHNSKYLNNNNPNTFQSQFDDSHSDDDHDTTPQQTISANDLLEKFYNSTFPISEASITTHGSSSAVLQHTTDGDYPNSPSLNAASSSQASVRVRNRRYAGGVNTTTTTTTTPSVMSSADNSPALSPNQIDIQHAGGMAGRSSFTAISPPVPVKVSLSLYNRNGQKHVNNQIGMKDKHSVSTNMTNHQPVRRLFGNGNHQQNTSGGCRSPNIESMKSSNAFQSIRHMNIYPHQSQSQSQQYEEFNPSLYSSYYQSSQHHQQLSSHAAQPSTLSPIPSSSPSNFDYNEFAPGGKIYQGCHEEKTIQGPSYHLHGRIQHNHPFHHQGANNENFGELAIPKLSSSSAAALHPPTPTPSVNQQFTSF